MPRNEHLQTGLFPGIIIRLHKIVPLPARGFILSANKPVYMTRVMVELLWYYLGSANVLMWLTTLLQSTFCAKVRKVYS